MAVEGPEYRQRRYTRFTGSEPVQNELGFSAKKSDEWCRYDNLHHRLRKRYHGFCFLRGSQRHRPRWADLYIARGVSNHHRLLALRPAGGNLQQPARYRNDQGVCDAPDRSSQDLGGTERNERTQESSKAGQGGARSDPGRYCGTPVQTPESHEGEG